MVVSNVNTEEYLTYQKASHYAARDIVDYSFHVSLHPPNTWAHLPIFLLLEQFSMLLSIDNKEAAVLQSLLNIDHDKRQAAVPVSYPP